MKPEEKKAIIKDFIKFCKSELQIQHLPKIKFTKDKNWATGNHSFGAYAPDQSSLTVYIGNRNLADILRTLAHELVHHRQNELGQIKNSGAGSAGTPIENQANALAGVLMRKYGKMNDLIYETSILKNNTSIKLLEILKELAYASSEYDTIYDEEDGSLIVVEYVFKTEKNKYKVQISSKEEPRNFQVSFGIDTGELNKIDTFQMTGEGDAKRIIETVCNIINQFYYDYKEDVDKITVKGTDEKRSRIYKKLMPQYIDPEVLKKTEIE